MELRIESKVKSKSYNKRKFIYNVANIAAYTTMAMACGKYGRPDVEYTKHLFKNSFTPFELHLLKRYSQIFKHKNVVDFIDQNFL